MSDAPAEQEPITAPTVMLQGIAGSPGIAIGKAYLVEHEDLEVVDKRFVTDTDEEINRFKRAVKAAEKHLQDVIDEVPEEFRDHVYILDAHMMLLKDKMVYRGTIDHISEQKVNAEWALKWLWMK